ncbi:hypothetical protein COW36_12090 [bacterium (Candidatus Blackallbacteria) CG17_big_fil_post_rev_8_21_14_2_50_48_46]|uniref:Uncharacterized protein n=1 Tax=bacterium (Candidatus Blackallbacteria) CG17_big_fil_post_rev_8_21_14_2_50_48_46 TaxID=2014261 RepID=A0A2M7G3P5_9BACT|nr:MAG: hypothetical protein COW64_03170 [bacterium (Candidatus Blackallbacteria) CG18_big_fil_WC_8_21_14_2_50_49_26]PIW16500.1 MAG: hypothetical protein COW36_12090 [bacterium (Candidatus Blackallbacteria) CG17_big_fil_post_rev_8_21_14_2_50_48_46]PIW46008.1 MAG: hypothetical protein COW20_17355 [bacterium (Candidatus Blackallbacteria) CG13_big_fil_rev_8_21_14_2_50_49_14]
MKKLLALACLGALLMGATPKRFWSGHNLGFQLEFSSDDLRVKAGKQPAKTLFDAFPAPDPEMPCTHSRSLRPLSWVGPYFSYQQEDYWSCKGTAHPGAATNFQAIDLRKPGKALRLTDLFPDAEVLKALLAEPVIAKTLAEAKIAPRFKNTEALLAQLNELNGECLYSFGKDMLEHFSFHHLQASQVAVRIGLMHGCEAARGHLTQLGILLPVPASMTTYLQQSQAGKAGFLMAWAEKKFAAQSSVHERVEPGSDSD